MPVRPKLVFAVALALVAYIALTAIWVLPEWQSLEAAQAFAIAKHLVVVLLIVASLFFYPRVGCWVALTWSAIVPFERYVALFREIMAVASGAPFSIAVVDIVRVLLLFAACVLSAALVFTVQRYRTASSSVQADA